MLPDRDLLARLGVFFVEDFLEPAVRRELTDAIAVSHNIEAPVGTRAGGPIAVYETLRRTKVVDVPTESIQLIRERLLAIRPQVEAHFEAKLVGLKTPQFLAYHEGDFFTAHLDWNPDDEYAREREITAIVFLNGPSSPDGEGYAGGSLVLYGLMGEEAPGFGIPLVPEPGLLVAFHAQLVHEVTPITAGERLSVVSWYINDINARDDGRPTV